MFSFREVKRMAEYGDGVSQFLLGFLHEHGILTNRDSNLASNWYKAASDQGIVHAAYALYLLSVATREKSSEGIPWLKQAAQSGYVPAEAELGAYYQLNQHEEDADELAFKWTKSAADKGYLPALHRLADFYQEGEHIEHDIKKAEACLREGAEKGDPNCAYSLGSMLLDRQDSEQQKKEGLKWVQNAAKDGHPLACRSLSLIYGLGQHGAQRDRQLAEIFNEWALQSLSNDG